MIYRKIVKPTVDFVIALTLLVILLPLFLLLCLVLLIANRGDIFFVQPRPGKNEKIFKIIKFRTMNNRRDENGELLPDKDRLTAAGKFVRKTSLDEIPQLINVIKGDISLIGPRPLLVEYIPLYNEEQRIRHHVKPGITGWAQVNGRNSISWNQKFQYDIEYVNNLSLNMDVKIAFKTIQKVLKQDGISSENSVTMEKFRGNCATLIKEQEQSQI